MRVHRGARLALAVLALSVTGTSAACTALSGLDGLGRADDAVGEGGDGAPPGGDGSPSPNDGPVDPAKDGEAAQDALSRTDAGDGGVVGVTCPAGTSAPTDGGSTCKVESSATCAAPVEVPAMGGLFATRVCTTDTGRSHPTISCAGDGGAAIPVAVFHLTLAGGSSYMVMVSSSDAIVEQTVSSDCTAGVGPCSGSSGGATGGAFPAGTYLAVGPSTKNISACVNITVDVTPR